MALKHATHNQISGYLGPSSIPWGFPGGSEVKETASNAGDPGSIPGSGRSPGEGNGNPLQYFCLGNPMDGGAWWPTVHGVAKSWTRLSDFTSLHFYCLEYSSILSQNTSSQTQRPFTPGRLSCHTPISGAM